MPMSEQDIAEYYASLTDEVTGDILPESVRQALRDVPLAAVRRAFPPRRGCPHPDERLQPYSAQFDLCLDCGQMVPR